MARAVALALAPTLAAAGSVEKAQAFLSAAQLPTGEFAGSPVVSTALAVRALDARSQKDAALFALAELRPDNNEAGLARLASLAGTVYQDDVAVQAMRGALVNGAIGLAPGSSGADPIVLSWAARLAATQPQDAELLGAVLTWLAAIQRSDGSFGFADNAGDLSVTADVAWALGSMPTVPQAATLSNLASAWLATKLASRASLPDADFALLMLGIGNISPDLADQLSGELMARQAADGSFDGGDTRATVLCVLALRRALPDIVVSPPLVVQSEAVTGQSFSIPVQVWNRGASRSPGCAMSAAVTDSTGQVVLRANASIPPLDVNVGTTVQLDLGTQGTPGPRSVTVIANDPLTISEKTLENNAIVMNYRVANLPDLVIEPADITVVPLPPALYEPAAVTVRVRNIGDATAHGVHVQLFQGDPGAGGKLLGETYLNAVAPGVPRTLRSSLLPLDLNPVTLVARVDPENSVPEANEANNVASLTVTPVRPADMSVDLQGLLNPTASSCSSGGTISFVYGAYVNVTRFGHPYIAAELFPFSEVEAVLSLVTPTGLRELKRRVFPVQNWQTFVDEIYTLDTKGLPDGAYQVMVQVDPSNRIAETNKTNNALTKSFTLNSNGLAEFWLDGLTITPPGVAPGQPYSVQATVHNTGAATAVGVPVQLRTPQGTVSITVAQLNPGETAQVSTAATAPMTPGGYSIYATVNPGWAIQEACYTNDTISGTVKVLSSDLDIVSIDTSPNPIHADEQATVIVTVKNVGVQTGAGPFYVDVGTTSAPGSLGHGSGAYPSPGQLGTVTVPIPTIGLRDHVDLDVQVRGWGERVVTVPVQNADMQVSAAGIKLNPEYPGPSTYPTITVSNLGSLARTTSVRLYQGPPEDHVLLSSGSIAVPAGGVVQFSGPSFTIPSDPPFVVTAVVDEEGAITEIDEKNNVATRPLFKPFGETVVAFDETHGPGATVSVNPVPGAIGASAGTYSEWAKDLEARGYSVRTLDPDGAGFTASKVRGVDVIVLPDSNVPYSNSELAVWQKFLSAGNGLLYLGEWGSTTAPPAWQTAMDQFTAFLGIGNAHTFIYAPNIPCSGVYEEFLRASGGIATHPTTAGVNSITTQFIGSFKDLPAETQILLQTPASQWTPALAPAAVAFPFQKGRVVAIADTTLFESDEAFGSAYGFCTGQIAMYAYPDNRRFALQIIDWLAGGGGTDFLPDLAFVPSSIPVPATVTAGDLVSIPLTVRNIGGALGATQGATVRLYDGGRGSGSVIGEQPLDALDVGNEQTLTFTWDTTLAAGDHVLTAVVDPEDKVLELDEQNNVVTASLTVRASQDLRIDPSDLAPSRDGNHALSVTVHNVGFIDVAAGTRLLVTDSTSAGLQTVATLNLGAISARRALTVTVPWTGLDPAQSHALTATADADHQLLDPTRDDDTAAATFRPPALEIAAPLPGTQWGGLKDVTWNGSSDDNPNLTYFVAIAPEGGSFTGLGSTSAQLFTFDTRKYLDGNYQIRVTASDGLLAAVREVHLTIANGPAVRVFGPGTGTATASISAGVGTSQIALPANTRVLSATMAVTPLPSTSVIVPGPTYVIPLGLFDVGGTTWFFSTESGASNVTLGYRTSLDGGATWSARSTILTFGLVDLRATIVHNQSGFHIARSLVGDTNPPQYLRSQDGVTWSTPVPTQTGEITGTDEGLLLVAQGGFNKISRGSPDGTTWSPAEGIPGVVNQSGVHGTVATGSVHIVAWDGSSLRYYRAASDPNTPLASSVSAPASLDGASVGDASILAADGRLYVAYSTNRPGAGQQVWAQRCELARDCTRRDAWLPSPIYMGVGSGAQAGKLRPDLLEFVWPYWTSDWQANGLEGGNRFSPSFASGLAPFGSQRFLFGDGFLGIAGIGPWSNAVFGRSPGLTPTDLVVDVANDGVPDMARPGMPGSSVQLLDFGAALNAYLATHADGDDGVVDGFIQVPVRVTSQGVGQTVLRNLEVRYQPLNQIAGFADPSLFSPGASPGVLDTSMLSLLSPGPVAVMTGSGVVVRTLATTNTGGRYIAAFDGRDDSGALLPSGPYLIGAPGWPVGAVEIDNVLPTAVLNAGAEGSYGGVALIQGVATDADYAGTPKNFARYALDYTLDGATYQPIATGTSPVDGVLGKWDTRQLPSGSATLRLTVYDRAGNSASMTRGVNVSPGAPAAPAIDAPTVTGSPVDSTSELVAIAGSAEPHTTVSVFMNGAPVGSAPSDGRWTLPGVSLPAGVASITAKASRNGLDSPRAQAIQVARYALGVAVDAPAHATAGSDVAITVTVSRTSVQATPLGVRVTVKDCAGNPAPMVVSPSQQVLNLAGQGLASFQVTLSTGSAMPAAYQIVAEVISGGLLPASGSAPLVLDPAVSLGATLSSDRATYDALQVVSFNARVLNGSHAADSGPLTAMVTVTGPVGPPVDLGPFTITSIPSNSFWTQGALYGAPPLAVGVYLAGLTVVDLTGAVVAVASTSFEVQAANGAGALAGTLNVTPTTYTPGDQLSAAYTVTNAGGDALVGVSLLLMERTSGAVVSRLDQTVAVARGLTVPGTVTLSTRGASGGELIALLIGNGRGLAGQTVEPSSLQDTTPPVIAISGATEGEYRAGAVTPVITVTDPDSPFSWQATLDGQPYTGGTAISAEGDHDLVVNAEDVHGNKAAATRHFTVDTIAPVVGVSGVAVGDMRRDLVTPVISSSDLHLRDTSVTLDGQPFASGTTLSADGDYTIVAFADDLAANSTTVTVPFTIDRTPPLITITGVADGALTNLTVFPVVQIVELHPASESVLLDGAPWDGLPVVTEGDHELEVQAADLAGNTSHASVRFSIDKTPPVIAVAGVSDGDLVNHAVQPVVTVTDLHSPVWTTLLGGLPWLGTPVSGEGDHVLTVSAGDAAGNTSQRAVRFTIDLTPPVIQIAGVSAGKVTRGPVTPIITVTDLHSPIATATLNGQPFASGASVSAEGEYDLAVHAVDGAGNPCDRALHFAIDRTPPAISIAGVTNGLLTSQAVSPAVSVTDTHLASQTVTLDGQPFTSGSLVHLEGDHALHVDAADAAGNTSSADVQFTQDFTPPVIHLDGVTGGGFYHDPVQPTFYATDLHGPTWSATLDGTPFTSGSVVQANAVHTLAVAAQDGAGNTSNLSTTFEVFIVNAALSVRYDDDPRVLVALDCGGVESCASSSAGFLLRTLDAARIQYEVALDGDSFAALLRTHRHNVRIVYRSHSAEASTYEEAREATFAGGGLIVVNAVPADADPKLEPALGAATAGAVKNLGAVSLVTSDLGKAKTLSLSGDGVAQALAQASAVGTTSAGKVVVSTNRYGGGRAVTFTFDPERNASSQAVAELLVAAVRFGAGSTRASAVPGSPQYLGLVAQLASQGPVDLELAVSIPPGVTMIEPIGPASPTWLFTLGTGEVAERSLVVREDAAGTYPVDATLTAIHGAWNSEVARAGLDLVVTTSRSELLTQAVTAVAAIAASGPDAALKADALSNLTAVNLTPATASDAKYSIGHVLHAVDDVLAMSTPQAASARQPLDALLRAVEVVSTTLPQH